MIKYSITSSNPISRWVEIKLEISEINTSTVDLQLPAWRPGRYELGNFAKNVSQFSAKGNQELKFEKITKDLWRIETNDEKEIIVSYRYYASELNAGSTYTCDDFLYVNPVNCLMYIPEQINSVCELQINTPSKFELAIGKTYKKNNSGYSISFKDFHELADSPFIASSKLQSKSYEVEKTKFTVWFNGECKPDWTKITKDFKAFTERQIKSFGKFTCEEYHFFVHALPFTFYHGVEHLTSSVNALGPGYAIMEERYVDLLGLCSHELYHTWNIKSIRPIEMFPYRYHKENYFHTGYVAEGVTTYMGDMLLYASDVFDQTQFLKEMNVQIQKHMDNGGRNNYSVAESGFDSWLDGYVPGVPDRKVSIYTEGCLIAMMTDILILHHSGGKNNLDSVMKELFHEFALKGKGYTPKDYRDLVIKYAGKDFPEIYDDLVNGTSSYLNALKPVLDLVELEILSSPSSNTSDRCYGMKIVEIPEKSVVVSIFNDSPASKVLALNDQIITINNLVVKNDANRWFNYFGGKKVNLTILRGGEKVEVELNPDGKNYYDNYYFSSKDNFPNELAKLWKER